MHHRRRRWHFYRDGLQKVLAPDPPDVTHAAVSAAAGWYACVTAALRQVVGADFMSTTAMGICTPKLQECGPCFGTSAEP
mmetsp:Transcript_55653/g.130274  ORF Transcript_55653/g.130274 Transcript_55653/m.130274 type:complete len:80 (-) Transcript_55653:683-922(-)